MCPGLPGMSAVQAVAGVAVALITAPPLAPARPLLRAAAQEVQALGRDPLWRKAQDYYADKVGVGCADGIDRRALPCVRGSRGAPASRTCTPSHASRRCAPPLPPPSLHQLYMAPSQKLAKALGLRWGAGPAGSADAGASG